MLAWPYKTLSSRNSGPWLSVHCAIVQVVDLMVIQCGQIDWGSIINAHTTAPHVHALHFGVKCDVATFSQLRNCVYRTSILDSSSSGKGCLTCIDWGAWRRLRSYLPDHTSHLLSCIFNVRRISSDILSGVYFALPGRGAVNYLDARETISGSYTHRTAESRFVLVTKNLEHFEESGCHLRNERIAPNEQEIFPETGL